MPNWENVTVAMDSKGLVINIWSEQVNLIKLKLIKLSLTVSHFDSLRLDPSGSTI